MSSKNIALFVGVLVFTVASAMWIADGFANDKVDNSWRPSAYNRQVTDCISTYEPVARVYDFDRMSDRTNAQLAEITGVSVATINACRR